MLDSKSKSVDVVIVPFSSINAAPAPNASSLISKLNIYGETAVPSSSVVGPTAPLNFTADAQLALGMM